VNASWGVVHIPLPLFGLSPILFFAVDKKKYVKYGLFGCWLLLDCLQACFYVGTADFGLFFFAPVFDFYAWLD